MLVYLVLAAYAGLLVYAACSDIARLIIPNWVSIALAALYPVAALISGASLGEIAFHFVFAGLVLTVGYFLFAAKIFGGGDAKLLAAVAIWTGITAFSPFFFWTAISGGVMALALLGARYVIKQAETNPPFVNRLLAKQEGIPYGVAIMVGGLMAIPSLSMLSVTLTIP